MCSRELNGFGANLSLPSLAALFSVFLSLLMYSAAMASKQTGLNGCEGPPEDILTSLVIDQTTRTKERGGGGGSGGNMKNNDIGTNKS